jgi:uncharacterized protein (TIGR02679 family)
MVHGAFGGGGQFQDETGSVLARGGRLGGEDAVAGGGDVVGYRESEPDSAAGLVGCSCVVQAGEPVRALLATAGVIADRLSATVLLFNINVTGDGPIDRRLRESSTPVALTLLDLVQHPPDLAPQTLTVVENPSVLEVAFTAGVLAPLACTSGHLRAIDHTLFQLAVRHGVKLRYAGDIDAAGRQIAAVAAATYGAELIAMDEATAAEARLHPPATCPPTPRSDDATGPAPDLPGT